MTTLELEARKASLAREVLDLDSWELVEKAADYLHRLTRGRAVEGDAYPAGAREEAAPYGWEEIDAWIDRSEADIAAGRVYDNEEVEAEERKAFPWLTK